MTASGHDVILIVFRPPLFQASAHPNLYCRMHPQLHLSLGVASLEESIDFFTRLLGASVTHRDPSGYVNVDLCGTQITLKQTTAPLNAPPEFHFGVNMSLEQFDETAKKIVADGGVRIVAEPRVVDGGTAMERKKMYVRCPSGYLVELKGYR